jgi:hypothetical protein
MLRTTELKQESWMNLVLHTLQKRTLKSGRKKKEKKSNADPRRESFEVLESAKSAEMVNPLRPMTSIPRQQGSLSLLSVPPACAEAPDQGVGRAVGAPSRIRGTFNCCWLAHMISIDQFLVDSLSGYLGSPPQHPPAHHRTRTPSYTNRMERSRGLFSQSSNFPNENWCIQDDPRDIKGGGSDSESTWTRHPRKRRKILNLKLC